MTGLFQSQQDTEFEGDAMIDLPGFDELFKHVDSDSAGSTAFGGTASDFSRRTPNVDDRLDGESLLRFSRRDQSL